MYHSERRGSKSGQGSGQQSVSGNTCSQSLEEIPGSCSAWMPTLLFQSSLAKSCILTEDMKQIIGQKETGVLQGVGLGYCWWMRSTACSTSSGRGPLEAASQSCLNWIPLVAPMTVLAISALERLNLQHIAKKIRVMIWGEQKHKKELQFLCNVRYQDQLSFQWLNLNSIFFTIYPITGKLRYLRKPCFWHSMNAA